MCSHNLCLQYDCRLSIYHQNWISFERILHDHFEGDFSFEMKWDIENVPTFKTI